MALPRIVPMLPTAIAQPFHRDGWVYEEKYDGWRAILYKDGNGVRLISRQGNDLTQRFPVVVEAAAELRDPQLVLDGELVVFDAHLRPRWEWLRSPPKDELHTPPVFMAFDCLWYGEDVRPQSLRFRRDVLEAVLRRGQGLLPVRRLAANGLEAWGEVLDRQAEGLVGKDQAAPYAGGRSLRWLKLKRPEARDVEAARRRWRR